MCFNVHSSEGEVLHRSPFLFIRANSLSVHKSLDIGIAHKTVLRPLIALIVVVYVSMPEYKRHPAAKQYTNYISLFDRRIRGPIIAFFGYEKTSIPASVVDGSIKPPMFVLVANVLSVPPE